MKPLTSALFFCAFSLFFCCDSEAPEKPLTSENFEQKKLAVTSFDNLTGQGKFDDLGQIGAEWIAQGLMQIENVRVLTPSTVRAHGKNVDSDFVLSLGIHLEVDYVFEGSYYLDQQSLLLKIRLVNAKTGIAEYHLPDFRASLDDPLSAVKEATERIMGYLLNREQIEKRITTPPKYEAYKVYLEGMAIYEVNDSLFRVKMNQALSLDANYFEPYLFLAYSYYYNNYNTFRSITQADSILQLLYAQELRLTDYQQSILKAAEAELTNDTDGAYQAFQKLFNKYPDDPFVRYNAGTFALFSNHLDKAISILSSADFERMDFSINVDKRNLIFLFDALHQKGGFQQILNLCDKYLRNNRAYFYELIAHINLGNEDAANLVFQSLDEQPDESLRRRKSYYYNVLGQEYLKLNRPNSAKLCLQKTMKFAPKQSGVINYERTFALFYLKSYTKGILELKALLKEMETPDRITERAVVLNFLAYFYAAQGELEMASEYQTKRDQLPAQHYFPVTDAYISLQAGEKDSAVVHLKEAYQAGVVFEDISFGHNVDFLPLHGYPPFDAFIAPK